jgi:GT2 family glycosyltransferase
MVRTAVTVVNYNTRQHLRACLESVFATSPGEVVVVDNGSTDGSIEMVRDEFPSVDVHVDWSNRGYGAAANLGIASCTAPYILLLNSDTVLERGALDAVGDYLDRNPQVGILGPRLRSRDGSLQRSCFPFPTPLLPFIGQRPLVRLLTRIPIVRDHHVTAWRHDAPRQVPWVVGAALAIRRAAFDEVGGFDESFHMYSEETDLCYRLGAAGWETHFAPVTDVTHAGSASTSQYRQAMLQELFLSSIRFYERHFTGRRLTVATAVTRLTIVARLWRDTALQRLTRSANRRGIYTENVTVWRRLLDDLS